MKVKTSVTLSEELLDAIAAKQRHRSEFLEAAAWAYLASQEREARYHRELALLNEHADAMNAEQDDALRCQTLSIALDLEP